MKQYFVYILRCSDQSYYTGVTNNLQQRINQHNEGSDPKAYTFYRRPVRLLFIEAFNDPMQAIAAEKQIKGWTRKKKEALVKGDIKSLKAYSECQNSTHYRRVEDS